MKKWYLTLQKLLVAFGFAQAKAVPTLCVWTRGGAVAMIVVYVDDKLI